MITESIKQIIRSNSERISKSNALLLGARNGTITKSQFVTYLYNLMYLFQHTPIHLHHAKLRCEQLGLEKLAEFMNDKIKEEAGHDQWAKNDLKKQSMPCDQVDESKIVPGTRALISYAKSMIDRDPTLFLAYMAFSEYFTVLVSPEFLDNLDKKCGIPRESITAIAYHEELDKDHVEDDLDIISKVVVGPHQESEMLRALNDCIDLVDHFLSQCVTTVQ